MHARRPRWVRLARPKYQNLCKCWGDFRKSYNLPGFQQRPPVPCNGPGWILYPSYRRGGSLFAGSVHQALVRQCSGIPPNKKTRESARNKLHSLGRAIPGSYGSQKGSKGQVVQQARIVRYHIKFSRLASENIYWRASALIHRPAHFLKPKLF